MKSLGVLCHVTSLPGDLGIGDFGDCCFDFIDFLSKNNLKFWQILPLNETNEYNCPYSSNCSFSFDEMFFDLKPYITNKMLNMNDIKTLKRLSKTRKVNYEQVKRIKQKILSDIFKSLSKDEFKKIKNLLKEKEDIIDFAYFKIVLKEFNTENFRDIPKAIWDKKSSQYKEFFKLHSDEILIKAYIQLLLAEQWCKVKQYANKNGIKIIGDLPIYPNPNSFDVFNDSSVFKLNKKTLEPLVYGGVPGDDFTDDGQMWGTCVYDWKVLEKNNFDYMINKIKSALKNYDILRLDHYFGYVKHYEWNAKNTTEGKWVKTNANLFFEKLKQAVDFNHIIVEDLGFDFKEASEIKKEFGLTGMSVCQMLFENPKYLPENSTSNDIYYLGTHDNNTFVGFYNSLSTVKKKEYCAQLKIPFSGNASKVLIKTLYKVMNSKNKIVILQIQDFLKQDGKYRMNVPGVAANCWEYRVPKTYKKIFEKMLNHTKERLV